MNTQERAFIKADSSAEDLLKRSLLVHFSWAGCCIFMFFGLGYLLDGSMLLGMVEILFGCLTLYSLSVLRRTDDVEVASQIFLLSVYCVSVLIFATGGVGDTGYLWILLIPLLTLFLLKKENAVRWLLVYVLLIGSLVVAHVTGKFELPYSYIELRQIFGIFLVVIYLTFFNEKLKANSRQQLHEKNHQLMIASSTDYLTRLPNRAYFTQLFKKEHARSLRSQSPLSMVMVDIDNFKQVNDQLGHQQGDEILIRVAQILEARIRESDTAVRWGGEEFVIICPDTAIDGALAFSETLRASIEKEYQEAEVAVTASFGVAQLHDGEAVESLMRRADQVLYLAKDGGRNRVVAC
jgi:diguanylate cyclase (GGDEF)-like protein